jgi:hypothetical protein
MGQRAAAAQVAETEGIMAVDQQATVFQTIALCSCVHFWRQ